MELNGTTEDSIELYAITETSIDFLHFDIGISSQYNRTQSIYVVTQSSTDINFITGDSNEFHVIAGNKSTEFSVISSDLINSCVIISGIQLNSRLSQWIPLNCMLLQGSQLKSMYHDNGFIVLNVVTWDFIELFVMTEISMELQVIFIWRDSMKF